MVYYGISGIIWNQWYNMESVVYGIRGIIRNQWYNMESEMVYYDTMVYGISSIIIMESGIVWNQWYMESVV